MIDPITLGIAGLALAGSFAAYRVRRRRRMALALPSMLDENRVKLKELKGYTSKILNARVNAKVRGLSDRAEKLLRMMEREPARWSGGKALVNFILETACRVAKAYGELSTDAGGRGEVQATLQRLEDSVALLEEAFDKQLQKAVEKDIISIDVELEMLKKTLKMEGL